MRISDWSSDVCSSDLVGRARVLPGQVVATGDVEPGQQSVGEHVVGAMTGHGASSLGSDGSSIVTSTPSSCAPEISSRGVDRWPDRSEEHTSELQSLMRLSYAVFCLKKNKNTQ